MTETFFSNPGGVENIEKLFFKAKSSCGKTAQKLDKNPKERYNALAKWLKSCCPATLMGIETANDGRHVLHIGFAQLPLWELKLNAILFGDGPLPEPSYPYGN